jgi:hypothetical protein
MFDTKKMSALDKAYTNALYVNRGIDKNNYLDGSVGGFF